VEADRETFLRLNQPQTLPMDSRGGVCLEDGLRIDYRSTLARAKLCEVALALAPIVRELDFGAAAAEHEAVQLRAVEAIRNCLDIVTFQRGLDRGRLSAMCDDAAKFMCRGQGHCHTVTSTMAAALYPFCRVLGLDLKFRGGYSWDAVNNSEAQGSAGVAVADEPERHQWLEVATRPSMRSFAVDLWVADIRGPEALRWPIEDCYMTRMYPHGKFGIGQTVEAAQPADFDLPEL